MKKRRIIMALGFVAAFTGDWFLVICGCGLRKPGFLGGVAAFTCAHLLWMAANGRESKIEWKALLVVLLPIAGFFSARVWGRIPASVFWATSGYTVVSALSLAVAVGTRRWCYALGIGCLVVSDVFIATTWVGAPHWHAATGPFYIAALLLVATSLVRGERERRFRCGEGNPLPATLLGGLLSAGFFAWAILVYPGGGYNPLRQMLSVLGEVKVKDVAYPLTHYLFCLGMVSGAGATLYFAPFFRAHAPGRIRKEVIGWGAALCAASLLLIAFVPWNINGDWHDAGCCGALAGGVAMLVSLCVDHAGKVGLACLMTVALIFLVANVLHVLGLVPFSPAVTATQKLVIVSFMLWQVAYAVRFARSRAAGRVS